MLFSFPFNNIQNSSGLVPTACNPRAIVLQWQWNHSTVLVTCINDGSIEILKCLSALSVLVLNPLSAALFLFPSPLPGSYLYLFFLNQTSLHIMWISGLFSTSYPVVSLWSQAWDCRVSPGDSLAAWYSYQTRQRSNCARHSWPLNNTGLNCTVPLVHGFLSMNTIGPSHPQVLFPQIQATRDRETVFTYSQPQIPNLR